MASDRVQQRHALPPRPRTEKERSARLRKALGTAHFDERGQLREPAVPLREIDRDDWSILLTREYLEVAGYVADRDGDMALRDPLLTIESIEGRSLTAAEESWYSSPWRWEVPLARCGQWLRIRPFLEDDIPEL